MRWYYQLDSHGIFKLCDTAFPELIMVINNNNIQHTHTHVNKGRRTAWGGWIYKLRCRCLLSFLTRIHHPIVDTHIILHTFTLMPMKVKIVVVYVFFVDSCIQNRSNSMVLMHSRHKWNAIRVCNLPNKILDTRMHYTVCKIQITHDVILKWAKRDSAR